MLDEKITNAASQLIEAELGELRERRDHDLKANQRYMASKGLYNSGGYLIEVKNICEAILDMAAAACWSNLIRTHEAHGAEITDSLPEDLKTILQSFIENEYNELEGIINAAINNQRHTQQQKERLSQQINIKNKRDRILQKYGAEVDLYVAAIGRSDNGKLAYQFNAPIGSVVIGDHATVIQNIGESQKQELLAALQEIKQVIENRQDMPEENRGQLIEIIEDSESEAGKDKPNTLKLKSYLDVLVTTIRGLRDAPGAVETIQQILRGLSA